MSSLELIGFLDIADAVSSGVGPTSRPDPDQLTIKFEKVTPGEQIVGATGADFSRITNLFQTAWVYLRPDSIIGYKSDGTTTTLLFKPIATVVYPGKNTDIYSLYAIRGTVDEKIVSRQSAVELTTASSNIILPTDSNALSQITKGVPSQPNTPNVIQGQIGTNPEDLSLIWRQAWISV